MNTTEVHAVLAAAKLRDQALERVREINRTIDVDPEPDDALAAAAQELVTAEIGYQSILDVIAGWRPDNQKETP